MGSICGVLSQSVSIAAQKGPINHPGKLAPIPSSPSQQRPYSARPGSARPCPALLLAVQSPAPLRKHHNGAPAAPPPDARLGDPAPPRSLRLSGSVLEVGLRRVLLEKQVGLCGETGQLLRREPGAGRGCELLGLLFLGAWAWGRGGVGHSESFRASGSAKCAQRAGVVDSGLPRA